MGVGAELLDRVVKRGGISAMSRRTRWWWAPWWDSTRATRVADLEVGRVAAVIGCAYADGAPWELPLSDGEAATLTLRVYESVTEFAPLGMGVGPTWSLVEELDRGDTFWLEDATGVVRVERRGWSELSRSRKHTSRSLLGTNRRSVANLERYASRHGPEEATFFRGIKGYRYEQEAVPEGATVAVRGVVRPFERGPPPRSEARGYRELALQHRVLLEPPGRDELVIRVLDSRP